MADDDQEGDGVGFWTHKFAKHDVRVKTKSHAFYPENPREGPPGGFAYWHGL
jgi:hypothetical protein